MDDVGEEGRDDVSEEGWMMLVRGNYDVSEEGRMMLVRREG